MARHVRLSPRKTKSRGRRSDVIRWPGSPGDYPPWPQDPVSRKRRNRYLRSEKGVNERGGSGSPGKEQRPHEQQGEQDGKEPPFFIFLQKNPEFEKESTSSLGGLFFKIGGLPKTAHHEYHINRPETICQPGFSIADPLAGPSSAGDMPEGFPVPGFLHLARLGSAAGALTALPRGFQFPVWIFGFFPAFGGRINPAFG